METLASARDSWGGNAIPCRTALPIAPASLALILATMAKVVRTMQIPSTGGISKWILS
jgi:hypothetical protein